ncbi:MAG: ABC transporter permease [Desulfovibrionaceae bacterium]|nr:ABC transporter permease [Desulfovibrionaceae bacterium]
MQLLTAILLSALRTAGLVVSITVLVFFLVRVIPGDVVDLLSAEGGLDAAMQEEMRQELGLQQSRPAQLGNWAANAVHGDFGDSLRFHKPVGGMVCQALPTTIILSSLSFAYGLFLGCAVAVLAVLWPKSFFPKAVETLNAWSVAMPTFCAGLLGILVVVLWLEWMPMLGNMFLAVVVLGTDVAGQIAKPLYEDLKETATSKFIMTAKAKGLGKTRVILFHLLPNSLSVILALSGIILGGLVGGTITLEVLFGLPGIGKLALDGVLGRDYPLVQAVILLLAVAVVCINWFTDIIAKLIDPRLRSH